MVSHTKDTTGDTEGQSAPALNLEPPRSAHINVDTLPLAMKTFILTQSAKAGVDINVLLDGVVSEEAQEEYILPGGLVESKAKKRWRRMMERQMEAIQEFMRKVLMVYQGIESVEQHVSILSKFIDQKIDEMNLTGQEKQQLDPIKEELAQAQKEMQEHKETLNASVQSDPPDSAAVETVHEKVKTKKRKIEDLKTKTVSTFEIMNYLRRAPNTAAAAPEAATTATTATAASFEHATRPEEKYAYARFTRDSADETLSTAEATTTAEAKPESEIT